MSTPCGNKSRRAGHVMLMIVWMMLAVQLLDSAMLWFEEPPDPLDPCTIVVPSSGRGEILHYHPRTDCLEHNGLLWFGTFGRVHLYLYYDTERDEEKRQNFQVCLTAGSPDRAVVWYNTTRNSWAPISFPVWKGPLIKSDMCKPSVNGTMDLILEPPWAFVNYISYVSWNVTFIYPEDNNATDATNATSSAHNDTAYDIDIDTTDKMSQ